MKLVRTATLAVLAVPAALLSTQPACNGGDGDDPTGTSGEAGFVMLAGVGHSFSLVRSTHEGFADFPEFLFPDGGLGRLHPAFSSSVVGMKFEPADGVTFTMDGLTASGVVEYTDLAGISTCSFRIGDSAISGLAPGAEFAWICEGSVVNVLRMHLRAGGAGPVTLMVDFRLPGEPRSEAALSLPLEGTAEIGEEREPVVRVNGVVLRLM